MIDLDNGDYGRPVTGDATGLFSQKMKELIAAYEDVRDLINIGAYVAGSNTKVDEAISKMEGIHSFLRQKKQEVFSFEKTMKEMMEALKIEKV